MFYSMPATLIEQSCSKPCVALIEQSNIGVKQQCMDFLKQNFKEQNNAAKNFGHT